MSIKFLFAALSLSFACAFYACGGTGHLTQKKDGNTFVRVIEATVQRSFLGVRAAPPVTDYKITVIWKQQSPPEGFFWKSADGWMPCNIYLPRGAPIEAQNIHQGDTLELVPSRKSKTPPPNDVPANINNAIYFKTSQTKWLSVVVKDLRKKPDIVMP